jgi:alkylated DNA repair protein alkB family protein 1
MDLLKVVEKHFIHADDPARRLQREERRALNVAVRAAMEACASKAIGDPLEVIDFSNLDRNTPRNRARIVELDAPPHVAAASCSPNAKYFRISDIDGLYFISNCLTPQQQFDWSLRSVREFSNLPYTNLSNLHGEQPNHWKNAVESGSLDTFRTLRWANIGFSYNWSKREYVEFGRSDNTALPNSINAAANGAKFTDTSSSRILELESHFPADLGALAAELAAGCNMPMEVESGICNFYCTSSAHMGCHVDDAEHDLTKPVVGLRYFFIVILIYVIHCSNQNFS